MTALRRARQHLDKARQFLEAAEVNSSFELYDAAASSAATSGINSKDAICLTATGTTGKSDNHSQAVAELKAAGEDAASLAATFRRLLSSKSRAQYQATPISASDAEEAVKRAQRMYTTAQRIVAR